MTQETIFHHDLLSYQNCNIAGGYPRYVQPVPGWRNGAFLGCIPLVSGYNSTGPSPPSRATLYIQPQGHGNRRVISLADPFEGGHGIIYFPTNIVAETPSSVSQTEEVAYKLQWMDAQELGQSFWGQRLNFYDGQPTSIFQHDQDVSGPHDVYYRKRFICSNDVHACPTLFDGRAKAPWGARTEAFSEEHVGDWHNHPAWTWAHHYRAKPGMGQYFDYLCLVESCRLSNTYVYNIFWDDAAWGLPGSGGGDPPGPPRPPKTGPPQTIVRRLTVPELRWDFDTQNQPSVHGPQVEAVTVLRIDDPAWGAKRGTTILRVIGKGSISVRLEGSFDASAFGSALVRYRQTSTSAQPVVAEWLDRQGTAPTPRSAVSRSLYRHPSGWRVVRFDLATDASWQSNSEMDTFTLRFQLNPWWAEALELDFVLLDSR